MLRRSSPKSYLLFARRLAGGSLFAGAAALTLLCSCSKPPEPPPIVPATPIPAPTAVPKPPTPTPTPVPVGTPTPTPIVHRYAPDGTYFVTEDVSVRLKAGLMGVSRGTQVKLVRETGSTATVNDGTQDFDLQKSQLTNDLDEAAKIQKSVQSANQANAAYQRLQQAAYEKQQQEQIEFLRAHPLSGSTTGTPTPAPRR